MCNHQMQVQGVLPDVGRLNNCHYYRDHHCEMSQPCTSYLLLQPGHAAAPILELQHWQQQLLEAAKLQKSEATLNGSENEHLLK